MSKQAKITNPNSSYFNKDVNIIQYLENERVELFVVDEEILIVASLNDIAKQSQTFKPDSRKSFYEFVQDSKNSRVDIQNTLELMIKESLLTLSNISKEELFYFFENPDKDRQELVDDFRRIRDEGKIEFHLINNNQKFNPKHKKKPHSLSNYKKTTK